MKKIKLTNIFNEIVQHTRHYNVIYSLEMLVSMIVVGVIAGARSIAAVSDVWSDTVIRKISSFSQFPDPSTITRVFHELRELDAKQLQELNHSLRGKIWNSLKNISNLQINYKPYITIDIDSSVETVYGNQEGACKGYNDKKRGKKSYHPLLAFCAETKEILLGWLRPGDSYTSNNAVNFIKSLDEHIGKNKIRFLRADSGFFSGEILDTLFDLHYYFIIKVKLKNLNLLLAEQQWTEIRHHPGYEQCDFMYKCAGWKREYRFVGIRRFIGYEKMKGEKGQLSLPNIKPIKKYEHFCFVTNRDSSPLRIWKEYRKRATCENTIEESKNQMALGKLRTSAFWANECLFQCTILAYNISRWMLLSTGYEKMIKIEPNTFRTYVIRTAGKLVSHQGRFILYIPKNHFGMQKWKILASVVT